MNTQRTDGPSLTKVLPEALLARLGLLEVPPKLPRGPLVYFVRRGGEVKIGFTHRLSQRMAGLGGGDLILLGTVAGTTTTERMYHQRFAHLRAHGEWFYVAPDLLDAISREASAPTSLVPGYEDIAIAFRKKARAYLTTPSNSQLITAQTNVGFWLNMLANGETPERLAALEQALKGLERVTSPPSEVVK